MSTLRKCQLGFARAMADLHFAARFAAHVHARGLPGARRIQVYRNNHLASLTDALAAVYPVIRRLVGAAFFEQTAVRYAQAYASFSGDIHHYGAGFGAFLGSAPGAGDHPYLPDVARLEWVYHTLFHRSMAPTLDVAELARRPVETYDRLRFHFQPAAQLYSSRYPVLRIWQANQDDSGADQTIELDAGATRLLVRRDVEGVVFQPLTPGEYVLLEQLAAGAALGDAFECARSTEPRLDLPAVLRRHVLHATLTGVSTAGDRSTASPHHGG